VIDPSIGLDAIRDVAIVAGEIAAIDADIRGDAPIPPMPAARSSPRA
jgi:predicted amidohydrolase